METPSWFAQEIIRGLAGLRVLKQRNPPSGEEIPGTQMTIAEASATEWIAVLWPAKAWSEKSIPRIREAFRVLPLRGPDWPTVHEFVEMFDELTVRAQNSGFLPAPEITKEEKARLAEIGNRRRQEIVTMLKAKRPDAPRIAHAIGDALRNVFNVPADPGREPGED